jgi:hypothetical protein
MEKYDEHGFLTRDWAKEFVPGFEHMNTCCQQLVLLFPEQTFSCQDIFPPNVEHPVWIPTPDRFPEPSPDQLYTAYTSGGGYGSQVHSVPTGGFPFLVAVLITLLIVFFRRRGDDEQT